jgi:hypothetical protein
LTLTLVRLFYADNPGYSPRQGEGIVQLSGEIGKAFSRSLLDVAIYSLVHV